MARGPYLYYYIKDHRKIDFQSKSTSTQLLDYNLHLINKSENNHKIPNYQLSSLVDDLIMKGFSCFQRSMVHTLQCANELYFLDPTISLVFMLNVVLVWCQQTTGFKKQKTNPMDVGIWITGNLACHQLWFPLRTHLGLSLDCFGRSYPRNGNNYLKSEG